MTVRRPRVALAALALCALTALAYSNSFQAGFALDNKTLLLEDSRIREATAPNVDLIFQHSYWWPYGESGLYRPLTTLSYLFNYAVLGNADRPAGYHWVNLILHLGNVLLVFAVAFRILRQFPTAVWIAGLWAVHPVLTESVTNIVGRADLLGGMAVLGGLLLYLKIRETAALPRGSLWLIALAMVAAAGMLAKESAVALFGVVLVYELSWRRPRPLAWAAILVPMLVAWWLRSRVLAAGGPAEFPFWDNPLTAAGFWTSRLTALAILPRYLGLTLWPLRLSCDYSYAQIPLAQGSAGDWLAWLTAAAVASGVGVLYRRNRTAFFFAGFSLVAILPTANLLVPIGTIMAERFLYLPAIGVVACVVLAVEWVSRKVRLPAAAPVIICVIAAGFAVRTWARNLDWRDDLTMATAAVRASPRSFKTHYLLAQAIYAADPGHVDLDRVAGEVEATVSILDSIPDALNDAVPYRWGGEIYLLRGDLLRGSPESERAWRRSLQLLSKAAAIGQTNGGSAELYHDLSACYLRLERTTEALEAATRAEQLAPLASGSYRQLADVLAAAGHGDDAAVKLLEGLILTGDAGLGDELLRLYRGGLDKAGCGAISGARGPALNPDCETVRRHFCPAAAEAMRVDLQTARRPLALETKRAAMLRFHCPVEPLNTIIP